MAQPRTVPNTLPEGEEIRTMSRSHLIVCALAIAVAALGSAGCSGGKPPEPSIGDACTFGELEGTIVGDMSECLLDDAFCVERPDGTWCTGPHPVPECPAGSSEIPTDAPCPEGYFCWMPGFSRQCARPL
jgi:hypothetical protein